jgi:hypothetical protein
MSDLSYNNVRLWTAKFETIDEDWLVDSLSDNDIEFPKDAQTNDDEDDDGLGTLSDDNWNDAGLEVFLKSGTANIVIPNVSSQNSSVANPSSQPAQLEE